MAWVLRGLAAARPSPAYGARHPGLRTRVCLLGLARPHRFRFHAPRVCKQGCGVCAAPQLYGPAGLGVPATGTADKGMSFRVLRGPAAAPPRRVFGARQPGLHIKKAYHFGFCTAPQLCGAAVLGCTATGTVYKDLSFRVLRGPAAARPRRFSVPAPGDCLQEYVL